MYSRRVSGPRFVLHTFVVLQRTLVSSALIERDKVIERYHAIKYLASHSESLVK